jgi:hypothetical protein
VFAQLCCDGPGKLFGGQRELRVDAGLVAARVLPVPTALQRVNSRKPWPSRVVHENGETFRFPPCLGTHECTVSAACAADLVATSIHTKAATANAHSSKPTTWGAEPTRKMKMTAGGTHESTPSRT